MKHIKRNTIFHFFILLPVCAMSVCIAGCTSHQAKENAVLYTEIPWANAYYDIIKECNIFTGVYLVDVNFGKIPEMFLKTGQEDAFDTGYSYQNGSVVRMHFEGDKQLPSCFWLYQNKDTKETLWIGKFVNHCVYEYGYQWYILSFTDFSAVSQTPFFQYTEIWNEEGTVTYRDGEGNPVTWEELDRQKELLLSDYEPMEAETVFISNHEIADEENQCDLIKFYDFATEYEKSIK